MKALKMITVQLFIFFLALSFGGVVFGIIQHATVQELQALIAAGAGGWVFWMLNRIA